MVRTLLVRGMLAGLLAGVVAFGFAWLFGEPQIARAVAFESRLQQLSGEAPEPVLVSRTVQSTIGLFTGITVYSCALGGLFALAFAAAHGRIGRLGPRATAALLAGSGFVVLILVPQLKYPPSPPAVGAPGTIGLRTALYFTMLALSLAGAVAALGLGRRLRARLGAWGAALTAGAAYVAAMAAVMLALPGVDEVPPGFAAELLWRFRLAAIGVNAVVWAVIGAAFAALAEPRLGFRLRQTLRAARRT